MFLGQKSFLFREIGGYRDNFKMLRCYQNCCKKWDGRRAPFLKRPYLYGSESVPMAENALKSVVEVWAPRGAQHGRLRQHGDSLASAAKMVGAHAWAPSAGFQPQKTLFAEKAIPVLEVALFRRNGARSSSNRSDSPCKRTEIAVQSGSDPTSQFVQQF